MQKLSVDSCILLPVFCPEKNDISYKKIEKFALKTSFEVIRLIIFELIGNQWNLEKKGSTVFQRKKLVLWCCKNQISMRLEEKISINKLMIKTKRKKKNTN